MLVIDHFDIVDGEGVDVGDLGVEFQTRDAVIQGRQLDLILEGI